MAASKNTMSDTSNPPKPAQQDNVNELPDVGTLNLDKPTSKVDPTSTHQKEDGCHTASSSDDEHKPLSRKNDDEDDKEEADGSQDGSDLDSNASIPCDAQSDGSDEPDFDYDSDGNIIYWVSAEEQAKWDAEALERYLKKNITPLERFLYHLPTVTAKELFDNEKICGICATPYEEGEMCEAALRLPCGHLFGRECLRTWMGRKEQEGYGKRSCFRCREKVVVPDEEN